MDAFKIKVENESYKNCDCASCRFKSHSYFIEPCNTCISITGNKFKYSNYQPFEDQPQEVYGTCQECSVKDCNFLEGIRNRCGADTVYNFKQAKHSCCVRAKNETFSDTKIMFEHYIDILRNGVEEQDARGDIIRIVNREEIKSILLFVLLQLQKMEEINK